MHHLACGSTVRSVSTPQIDSVAGFVLLAIALAFLCYMLPTMIRSRQVVSDARVDDRFSTGLRVLARAGDTPPRYDSTARVYLHTPRAGQVEAPMDRQPQPPAPGSAAAARQAAAQRAARAAAASRRAAAARRRRVLLLGLLALSLTFWVLFAATTFPIAPAIAATALLLAATVAGRRAAVRAARAEARERVALGPDRPRHDAKTGEEGTTTSKTGQMRHARRSGEHSSTSVPEARESAGSAGITEDTARATTGPVRTPVAERTGSLRISVDPAQAGAETRAGEGGEREEGWTPVPVPKPTYTLKAPAPRRTVRAYEPPTWEPEPAPATATEERQVTLAEVEQAIRERLDPQAPPATEAQMLAEQEEARAQARDAEGRDTEGRDRQGQNAQQAHIRGEQPGSREEQRSEASSRDEAAEQPVAATGAGELADAAGAEGLSVPGVPGQGSAGVPDHPKIDLQSVLERRRAVGQ